MITKKTSENAGLYDKLFADASEVLSEKLGTSVEIKTLDEYLFNLATLREYEVNDEQYSLRFSRLPVDEPPFAIDANARQIEIPASFKKNGIAVIGDHLAEILYFTIDRYYDTWDLLDDDIQVVAQWSYVSGGKTMKSGISVITEKDAKVFASENKIMFGWPINNTIAAAAGTIKFSIRFFKIADNHLIFNMNTIPTAVEVKNGLDFVDKDGLFLEDSIDDSTLVAYRFQNGLGYQGGEGGATRPVYIINLSTYESANEAPIVIDFGNEDSVTMDLDENGKLKFGLLASGNGAITYSGRKDTTANVIDAEFFYFLSEDEEADNSKTYYTYNSTEDKYEISEFDAEEDMYERIVGITADSVGTYWIVTTNTMIPSGDQSDVEANWSRYDDKSKTVIVPGPAQPSVEADESVYLDEENKLFISLTGSTEQEGDKINYTLTASGEGAEGADLVLTDTGLESGVEKTFAVGTIVTTEARPVNKYDVTFTASVTSSRNGATSDPETKTIRATYPTEAPAVSITSSNVNLTLPTTLTATITNIDDILSDSISYQWCKVTAAADDDESIEGATEATYAVTESGRFYCKVTNTVNGKPAETESSRTAITAE